MKIPVQDIQFVKETNRDNVGSVFIWENKIYRGINFSSVSHIRELLASGLIEKLSNDGLFPRTQVTVFELDGYGMVLEHERIKAVTYPFEWSFGMLQDAALAIIKVNQIAFSYGWQTKDCHGYNVLFNKSQPVFIDLGSFIPYKEGEAWTSFEEFLAFYYYPLKIWSYGDYYLSRFSMVATYSMPHESYFSYQYPLLRCLGQSTLARLARVNIKLRKMCSSSKAFIRKRFPGIVGVILSLFVCNLLRWNRINLEFLGQKIGQLKHKKNSTVWGTYHDKFLLNSSCNKNDSRFARIAELIGENKPVTVVDLAGNKGAFASFLLKKTAVETIYCIDSDENAVDSLYARLKPDENRIVPVLLDFMLPLQRISTRKASERFIGDTVVALAVTHHLLLSQNMPIDYVMKTIRSYTNRYAFIEFMPKGLMGPDGQAPALPEWYNMDWFRKEFSRYFTLYHEEQLAINRVIFCGVVTTI